MIISYNPNLPFPQIMKIATRTQTVVCAIPAYIHAYVRSILQLGTTTIIARANSIAKSK